MTLQALRPDDPKRIGPYRVEARLGSGGMGDVFLARSKAHGNVAVKVLRRELATDEQFRARFRREVVLARRVAGLCTARVVDADVDADPPWLASEFVEGPTLSSYVREHGPFEREELLTLAVALLEALHAIHDAGVVHRDLTPSNVILAASGPKVVDFGIAQSLDATTLTLTGGVIGTPAWMAPEQIAGARATPATDMFSWALVVAYAGLGRSAFGEGRAEVMLHRIMNDEPDLGDLPEPLASEVRRSLDKDPLRRPAVNAVIEGLANRDAVTQLDAFTQQLLDDNWTMAATATPMPVEAQHREGRRAVVTGAAVVIVILIGVAVVLLSDQNSSPDRADGGAPPSKGTSTTVPVASIATSATTPTTTTTASALLQALPSGTYANGSEGTPHYFVSITTNPDNTVDGTVTFLAQDGQTSVTFTFTGKAVGDAVTLTPSTGGTPISMTYGDKQFQLGECPTYLQFVQSLSECTFQYVGTGFSTPTVSDAVTTPDDSWTGHLATLTIGTVGSPVVRIRGIPSAATVHGDNAQIWEFRNGAWGTVDTLTLDDPTIANARIQPADVTGDGVPDFIVTYPGTTQPLGLVLSDASGQWRSVPFGAPNGGTVAIDPRVQGNQLVEYTNSCDPNCAQGTETPTYWTYDAAGGYFRVQ
jgi:serine/threonine protein kinase